MFRRKPSKIEMKVEDKQELEETRSLRSSSAAANATLSSKPNPSSTAAVALLHQLDRDRPTKDPSTIAQLQHQRIGLLD